MATRKESAANRPRNVAQTECIEQAKYNSNNW